jgi:thiol-disulfide isomerase/thioredoxin
MKRLLSLAWVTLTLLCAQNKPDPIAVEQEDLSNALAEAGSSPLEVLRAIEKHLAKYPDSVRKAELERAAVRAAITTKDEKRIVLYGERVLAREPEDTQILERVTRSLLASSDKDVAERALTYSKRLEAVVVKMRQDSKPEWQDELDRAQGRALVFQSRANGNLGRGEEAIRLAIRGYEIYPTAEAAREIARHLERTGKPEEAIPHLADAFSIPDGRNTEADRARDRLKMGELYRKAKGGEAGLGDLILEAYDRTNGIIKARELRLKQASPNTGVANAIDFTLSAVDGKKLQLATLKGKVVIFDFWATWCGPCRAQHPLYEQVKKRFHGNPGVVFLSVNTDEERDGVKPFLEEEKWKDPVYFEDGLARALQIASIPTTIVLDKQGEIFSRMNGFVPERFVDMLSDRIKDALAN